jgi:hypothetical protein
MNALKEYTKNFIAMKAHEAICKYLSKQTIRELRKTEGGTTVDGVALCVSNKAEYTYAPDVQACLDELADQVKKQKQVAEDAGKMSVAFTPHVKATVPKSTKKQILATVRDYAKYFGITK